MDLGCPVDQLMQQLLSRIRMLEGPMPSHWIRILIRKQVIGAWPKLDVDGVLLMFSVCLFNGIPVQAENHLHHTSQFFAI